MNVSSSPDGIEQVTALPNDEPDFSPIAHEPIDLNETFSPHIFDEEDETTLAHKILRCHRLCELVPPKQCITNIEQFVEGLTALLESQNTTLQNSVISLLTHLIGALEFGEIHRKLMFSLRHAFREGSIPSQLVLLFVSTFFTGHISDTPESIDNYLRNFDWDGSIHHKNMDYTLFQMCVHFLITNFDRLQKISPQFAESIFVEFDTHQHALTIIVKIITELTQRKDLPYHQSLFEYSLIMSFFFGKTLPDPIIQSICDKSSFGVPSSFFRLNSAFIGFHHSFLFNHTSFNYHPRKQQGFLMELLCERVVRSSPHSFFQLDHFCLPISSPAFSIFHLFGLHSLFFRGILPLHIALPLYNFTAILLTIFVDTIFHDADGFRELYLKFPPPLVVQFFALPICNIHSDGSLWPVFPTFLKIVLPLCAPFGECRSLAMLFREFSTVRHPNAQLDEYDLDVLQIVLDLHWPSIPTSFDSPLLAIASSINGISLTASDFTVSDSNLFQQDFVGDLILHESKRVKYVANPGFAKWMFSLSDRFKRAITIARISCVGDDDSVCGSEFGCCSDGVGAAWSVGCCGCVGLFVVVFGGLRKRSGSDWDSARDNAASGAEHADTSIRLLLLLMSSLSIHIDQIPLDEPVRHNGAIGKERLPHIPFPVRLECQFGKMDGK
ncbi:hypothetical protein BLNAU_10870 [Blattamonas nauphoetae]|uniref:Uncharacterized protein n=1 Tax=Blattamonas nauphoetae TaxID=2049346 RepID=A0ABQ9XRE0_9EUKA|nr:hypothetical protein BLNAU_10870 [Blattamonas nauphoetae]